jgi:hypothetical protein
MSTSIEDILESATNGVLRALEARKAGSKESAVDAANLVRSGFFVDVRIRAGGIPPAQLTPATEVDLNPQPLPP